MKNYFVVAFILLGYLFPIESKSQNINEQIYDILGSYTYYNSSEDLGTFKTLIKSKSFNPYWLTYDGLSFYHNMACDINFDSYKGIPNLIKTLKENGVPIDHHGEDQTTPLGYLVSCYCYEGISTHEKKNVWPLIETFLEEGASVKEKLDIDKDIDYFLKEFFTKEYSNYLKAKK